MSEPLDEAKIKARKEAFTPATTSQKIVLAVLLFVAALTALYSGYWVLKQLETHPVNRFSVKWKNEASVTLEPGPSTFWYDKQNHVIWHVGTISDERKQKLLGLSKTNDLSYRDAIEDLAFSSNTRSYTAFRWLLLLGGVSGILGVLIRSTWDFVGNTCYKNTLDVVRWWPWYVVRPLTGFLLGVLVIVLVQTDFLTNINQQSSDSLWWAGLATIAGFGSSDMLTRLRLVSKAIFGVENS